MADQLADTEPLGVQLRQSLREHGVLLTLTDSIDLIHALLQTNATAMEKIADALDDVSDLISAPDVVLTLRTLAKSNLQARELLISENQHIPHDERVPDVP